MKIFRSSEAASGQLSSSAVAIGNFDGVHRGHQALFARAVELARRARCQAVVLTFAPHPARFFKPELAPPLITSDEQKLQLLEAAGLDAVVVQPFNSDFAQLSPEEFVGKVLGEHLRACHVLTGEGFVFGRDRAGTARTLEALGARHGFVAHAIAPLREGALVISSTKVRECVLLGRVEAARTLLGRDFAVDGRVVTGDQRGRTIGFPTANVAPTTELTPKRGVYAGHARIGEPGPQARLHPCVINVGTAPTVRKIARTVIEAHLLDYHAFDLEGRRLTLSFRQRLRDERRFASLDELVQAIGKDVETARSLLWEQP